MPFSGAQCVTTLAVLHRGQRLLCLIVQLPVTCPPNKARRGKPAYKATPCWGVLPTILPLSAQLSCYNYTIKGSAITLVTSQRLRMRHTVQLTLGPLALIALYALQKTTSTFYFIQFYTSQPPPLGFLHRRTQLDSYSQPHNPEMAWLQRRKESALKAKLTQPIISSEISPHNSRKNITNHAMSKCNHLSNLSLHS